MYSARRNYGRTDEQTDRQMDNQADIIRRLVAENAALKRQLDMGQVNPFNQSHNYCILDDLSLKQTTV